MSEVSLTERISQLEDREAIKELTSIYCLHVVNGDGPAIADLFTQDGVFDMTGAGGPLLEGKAALGEFYAVVKKGDTIPLIHNHIIELAGEEAQGKCVVESRQIRGEPPGFVAHYEDQYRREGGKWRFLKRKVFFHIAAAL